jgi:hypothetical protein
LGARWACPLLDFFADARRGRAPASERMRLEAELREVARTLSDRDLAIAVAQLGAFLRFEKTK